MGIEQDIQQKNFRNEFQKAGINLIYTSNWLQEKVRGILDAEDITAQQFNILRILRGSTKPLSTLQIRERMLDKMSDTSRIVDRLLKKELVEKKACPSDKRLVDVSISKKGMLLLERLDERSAEMDSIMQHLSEDEARLLNTLLDKARDSATSSPSVD